MAELPSPRPPLPAATGAQATLRIGTRVTLEARITTGGLLAIGAIVSAALLGSAVIVRAARRGERAG